MLGLFARQDKIVGDEARFDALGKFAHGSVNLGAAGMHQRLPRHRLLPASQLRGHGAHMARWQSETPRDFINFM